MKSIRSTVVQCIFQLLPTCAIGIAAPGFAQQSATANEFMCGPLRPPGQFGPFDYRTVDSGTRHKVEDYHFTPSVETLKSGNAGTIGSDIDYTLRAFPNNPRALLSASRYALRVKSEQPSGMKYTAECYFERAIRFTPDDPMPRLLYAVYLKERKRTAAIRPVLEDAERLRGDPANFDFDYNLGLLYFDIGAYDKSLEAAKRAYELGAPLPALQSKLKAAGKWRD